MITEQQIQEFDELGAVTIDTPLTRPEIAAATAAIDRLLPPQDPVTGKPRYRSSMTCSYDDQALVDVIQHPFFEEVAKRTLHAEQVHFFQTAITASYPEPDKPFSFDQHVDIQYCLSDLEATPRRMICSYFLWFT